MIELGGLETALEQGDLVVAHCFREVHGVGRRCDAAGGLGVRGLGTGARAPGGGEGVEHDDVHRSVLIPMAIDAALHHVLQFANISGPGVTEQGTLGGGAKAGEYLPAELRAHAGGEGLRKQGNVFFPGPEGGQGDDVEGEAVEEILPKATLGR